MNKIILLLVLLLLQSACSNESQTELSQRKELNDFDHVCSYFDELSNRPDISTLSGKGKNDFIMMRLDGLADGNAKKAWTLLRNFYPDEDRYSMFKQAAGSVVETDWNCASMKILAASSVSESTNSVVGGVSGMPSSKDKSTDNVVLMKDAVWEGSSKKGVSTE